MKQIIFSILTILVCSLSAQEVISETTQYITYQDTLFTIKTTRIISAGYEGLNDTTVSYSMPTDTAGVVSQLHTDYLNTTNTAVAKMRNAPPFRFVLTGYLATKNTLALLGADLDSINVARYGNVLSGRWRIFREDGTNFVATIAPHPTQPGLLRATGENSEGNFNILIYGRHFVRFTVGAGDVKYLAWDGASTERPLFQNPVRMTVPTAISTSPNFRMVKVQ
jgi:hypothetical protein